MGNSSSSVSPSIEEYDDGSIDESNGDMLYEDPNQELHSPTRIIEVNTIRFNNYSIHIYTEHRNTGTELQNTNSCVRGNPNVLTFTYTSKTWNIIIHYTDAIT